MFTAVSQKKKKKRKKLKSYDLLNEFVETYRQFLETRKQN